MLTEEQQFKVAFLSVLADQGIGPDGAHQFVRNLLAGIRKQADLGFAQPVVDTVSSLAKGLGPWALAANFAIPGAMGAAGGYTLAKMKDMDDEDPAEMRSRESIDNYQRLADQLNMRRQLRDSRLSHTQAGRPLVR